MAKIIKYPLMGQYVEVNQYMKPRRKGCARSYTKINAHGRVGMIVGYRTVYEGYTNPASDHSGYYDNDGFEPAYFVQEKSIKVLLVAFWPTYNPVLVLPKDIMWFVNPLLDRDDVAYRNYHPTSSWDKHSPGYDKARAELRTDMKYFPRDENGRWKKP